MTANHDPFQAWDITKSPDPENIRKIIEYMSGIKGASGINLVPGEALTAIEALIQIAYPGEEAAYQCRICGNKFHAPKRSGKVPDLCKGYDCQKEANRQRVNKHRTKKQRIKAGS